MGFFSSTKLPQPPLPNIAIHLKTLPDKVFRPDDIVEGHVSIDPIVPITPRALEVSLFGQSLIWYRTSHSRGESGTDYHHWRDNAPLFEVTTSLLPAFVTQAPTLEVGETYTYPFEFRFPVGTSNNRAGLYKDDSDDRWTIHVHDLPPSFTKQSKYASVDQPDYAKIEYGVRARLMCPGIGIRQGKNLADFVVTEPVLFAPSNTSPPTLQLPLSAWRHPKNFTVQTSAFASEATQSIGFRQSMRDRFSSSTPKLEFESLIELPEFLTSGMEFRFRVMFNVVSKSDNVTNIPVIRFHILSLRLKDLTCVRAPRDFEASNLMSGNHRKDKYKNMPPPDAPFGPKGQEKTVAHKEATQLNSLPEAVTVELEERPSGERKEMEQASSCEAWFVARVPGFTPPSFNSFAVSRFYQVKVTLAIELAGKHFEHEAKGDIREMWSAPV